MFAGGGVTAATGLVTISTRLRNVLRAFATVVDSPAQAANVVETASITSKAQGGTAGDVQVTVIDHTAAGGHGDENAANVDLLALEGN